MEKINGTPYENSRYFTRGDYTIHYRIDESHGERSGRVFLIHGFGCNTAFYDEITQNLCDNGIEVVRVDAPDFGWSSREHAGMSFIPREKVLRDLMDELYDGTGWILMGHSMGGSICIDICNAGTDRIKALILICPMQTAKVPVIAKKAVMLRPVTKLMDLVMGPVSKADGAVKAMLFPTILDMKYMRHFDGKRASACFGEPGTGTGLCVMTAVCVPPDMEKAGKIPVPVLYIDADMDIFVTKKKREEFRKDLPDADKLTLRYGGHCMIQNRSPELMPEILYFLIKNGLIETTQVQ
mgnify:CR=1 FL=1